MRRVRAGFALCGALLLLVDVRAQQATVAVASVKVNRSGELGARIRPEPGGGFAASNSPLAPLIEFAYDYPSSRIAGLPSWTLTERFDIVVKPDASPARPAPEQPPLAALILRSVLAERFRLKTHSETREAPVYELRLASARGQLGPNLTPASREDCRAMLAGRGGPPTEPEPGRPPCGVGQGNASLTAGSAQIADIASALSRIVERPVLDRTGLTGTFDARLTFSPERLAFLPPDIAERPAATDAPSIFTALREQLGLTLDAARGPVDMLVVDSVERPTPD